VIYSTEYAGATQIFGGIFLASGKIGEEYIKTALRPQERLEDGLFRRFIHAPIF